MKIDKYIDQIINDADKTIYKEATKSAESGALRATYIMLWISCAESLKRKFKEAAIRDGIAKKISAEIDRREGDHKSVDVYILDNSREYGFIDDTQHTELKHIYEMRCICGHPYEHAPEPEQILSATAIVVKNVLSRPLKLKHGFLDAQLKLITTEKNYLDDTREAVAEHVKEIFSKIDESLLPWFLEKIWKEVESIYKDSSMRLYRKRCIYFAREMLKLSDKDILQTWTGLKELMLKYPCSTSRTFLTKILFSRLKDGERLTVIMNGLDRAKKAPSALKNVMKLYKNGVLNKAESDKVDGFIADTSIGDLSDLPVPLNLLNNRLIEKLKSHDWYVQNPVARLIQNRGGDDVAGLPKEAQRLLGNNILQAADGCARAARRLIDHVADSDIGDWPSEFIRGIVEECFINEKDEIRFKKDYAYDAVRTLQIVDVEARTEIMDDISARLSSGEQQRQWFSNDERDEMVAILNRVIDQNEPDCNCLTDLRNTIQEYDPVLYER